MFHKTLLLSDVELKFTKGDGSFEGYASVFNGVDSYGDTILPGAYDDVIAQARKSGRMPKMLANHRSWDMPIGKWTGMNDDGKGLHIAGEFTQGNPQADIVRAAMKHGTVDGLSIGFRLGEFKYVDGGDRRVIESIAALPEVSVVTFPADDDARIDLSSVKHELDEIENIRDFECFLRESGGMSKGLAMAVLARAKRLFGASESREERRGDPGVSLDAEATAELHRLLATKIEA